MMYLGKDAVGLATSTPLFANIANIEAGNYISTQDTLVSSVSFNHTLKATPDFIYIYTEPISNNGNNWSKDYLLQSNVSVSVFVADYSNEYYTFNMIRAKKDTTTYGSSYGGVQKNDFANSTLFKVVISSSLTNTLYFKANTVYHYIIGTFKEVTPNA